jgi:hypothetical protein
MADIEIPPTPSVPGKKIADPDTKKTETSMDFSEASLSNPYFTHHSDHPDLISISKPLNGDNYSTWKRAMTLTLNSKNKLCFVNGSIKAHSEKK